MNAAVDQHPSIFLANREYKVGVCQLLAQLDAYKASGADEVRFSQNLREFALSGADVFDRTLWSPGHVTGSAWIVDSHTRQVLLMRHRKLDCWLHLGGHAESLEHDPLDIAIREIREECGLDAVPIERDIFDIDIHTIPATDKEPQHQHFDVRFLFEGDARVPLVSNGEATRLQWFACQEVPQVTENISILRMVYKAFGWTAEKLAP